MAPSRLLRRTSLALAGMGTLLAVSAAVGWWGTRSERAATRLVEHTHEVLEHVLAVRTAVASSQGNLNAYLVTLDTEALALFRRNEADAHNGLTQLTQLTGDNEQQAARLRGAAVRLRGLDSARAEILQARRVAPDAASAAFATTGVVAHRRAVMALLDSLEYTERTLLAQRTATQDRSSTVRILALLAALLIAVVIGFWAVGSTRHEMRTITTLSAQRHALAEDNPDGVVVRVGEQIVYANTAAAALLGFAQGTDIIGRSLLTFLHPEEQPEAGARFRSRDVAGLTLSPTRRRLGPPRRRHRSRRGARGARDVRRTTGQRDCRARSDGAFGRGARVRGQ